MDEDSATEWVQQQIVSALGPLSLIIFNTLLDPFTAGSTRCLWRGGCRSLDLSGSPWQAHGTLPIAVWPFCIILTLPSPLRRTMQGWAARQSFYDSADLKGGLPKLPDTLAPWSLHLELLIPSSLNVLAQSRKNILSRKIIHKGYQFCRTTVDISSY